LKKTGFSGPFRQNRLSYSEITLLLFRTLPVAPGCNKVSENEKSSGNRYNYLNLLGVSKQKDFAPTSPCDALG
jgi:hypothetical protein